MSVRLEVWGEYACFSRPELKTERVSYDVITPAAARGLSTALLCVVPSGSPTYGATKSKQPYPPVLPAQ